MKQKSFLQRSLDLSKADRKIIKVLSIIPARGGSKGVPRKNIKGLSGKPLIAWTIEEALKSCRLEKVIVSTDDKEIKETSLEWGAEVPFVRSEELATDSARAIPVLQNAVSFMQGKGFQYDAIMMLQPTSPLRLARDIDGCIGMLADDTACSSVISVTEVGEFHPARMKYIEDSILVDPPFCEAYENQPRQELKPMYIRNGAVYLVRTNVLMESSSLKGSRSRAYIMPRKRSVNIDSKYDFELAEWLMSKPDWRDK